jgi:hypothetical protein
VVGVLIGIREDSQDLFTQIQNVLNTQIANGVTMQYHTKMSSRCFDPEIEMLCKEVLQSGVLRAKAEKAAKGVPWRQGKEILRDISAKDVEWQAQVNDLAEQVAKLSNPVCLDAKNHCGCADQDYHLLISHITCKLEGYLKPLLQCHHHQFQPVVIV